MLTTDPMSVNLFAEPTPRAAVKLARVYGSVLRLCYFASIGDAPSVKYLLEQVTISFKQ